MSISFLDIDIYCRVCLQLNDTNLSIFDEVQEFNMSISDLLVFYGQMTIDESDVYPKIICDECLRELLVVAKFKEKVKHSEDTLSRLTEVGRTSIKDDVSCEMIEDTSHAFNCIGIKEEEDKDINDSISESYEEIEFLDTIERQSESLNCVQIISIDQCEDEFIDEIIEECQDELSSVESYMAADSADSPLNLTNLNNTRKKSLPKQTSQHLNISDSKVIINFNCVYCGAGFMHSSNLKKHMATHAAANESFSLDVNDSIEAINAKLEDATEAKMLAGKTLKKNISKTHKCNHCDRAFVSRSLLSSHVRTHTGERPFACNQCDKNFATQGGLDLHTRRHLGLKNYVCNICQRRFVESSNLKVHMRTHTGERPHRCNRCNRSFSRVFLLQIHQRTHTGEKPFACDTCPKSFAQQGDLSAHRRIHSGEKPHRCYVCFKGFIKSSALTSHMRRHNDKIFEAADRENT